MLSTSQKSLLPGMLSSAHPFWSGSGLLRAFSSCRIRAARRIPTEEELSTMNPFRRWYYRKMDDPVYRRQRWDENVLRNAKNLANLKLTGGLAQHRERQSALEKARYQQNPDYKFTKLMKGWLFRLPVNAWRAFQWKTHLPMIYPERVRKTCSTCLSHHAHGARLW